VVEKSKQLILKIESAQTQTPSEVNNLINQSQLQQEQAIEDLQSKIQKLLQNESQENATGNRKQQVDDLLKNIDIRLDKLKEALQSRESQQTLSKEVRNNMGNLLKNLDTTLRRLPASDPALTVQRLETLDRALQNLSDSLSTNSETNKISEIRHHVLNQVNRLQEILEKSSLSPDIKKDIEAILNRLSESTTKIEQLKSADQLPEVREIIDKEIKPNLSQIQKILDRADTPTDTAQKETAKEIKNQVENLLKEMDTVLQKAVPPDKDIDTLLKLVENALNDVSATSRSKDISFMQKEIGSTLIKLREQILILEEKALIPEDIKIEVENLIKNSANVLRYLPASDNASPQLSERLEALSKAVANLTSATASTQDFFELRDRLVEQIVQLKETLDNSGVRVAKEVQIELAKLADAAQQLKQLNSPEQLPELREIVREEIKPRLNTLQNLLAQETIIKGSEKYQVVNRLSRQAETLQKDMDSVLDKLSTLKGPEIEVSIKGTDKALARLSEILEMTRFTNLTAKRSIPPPSPDISKDLESLRQEISIEISKIKEYVQEPEIQYGRDRMIPESRQKLDNLLEQVSKTIERIPRTPGQVEQVENLTQSLKNLRSAVETAQRFSDVRDQVIKQVEQLQLVVKNMELDASTRKEVEVIMNNLSRAAEKLEQLNSVEQLAEMRQLLEQEIKPNLTALNKTLDRAAQSPENQAAQDIQLIKEQVEGIRRDVDTALEKLPSQPPKEIDPLLKDVEAALSKVSELTLQAGKSPPQFSENIQTLYENIKAALRLLQANIQVSGNNLQLPEEIRQIFQGLQTNLKLSEVSDAISNQLNQLRALVKEAGIPLQRVVGEMLNAIDDVQARLGEIKAHGNAKEMQSFIQNHMKPLMESLGNIFKNQHLMGESENPGKISQAMQVIHSIKAGAENIISKGLGSSSELAQLTEFSNRLSNLPEGVRDALNQIPAGQKVSENISNLAKNIETLLSGLGDKLPEGAHLEEASTAGNSSGTTGAAGSNETDNSALTAKIRNLLSTLRSHFQPLDIGQDALKLVPRLKSLIEDSGIFFEKKLNEIISKLSEASDRLRNVQSLDQLPEIKNIIEKDLKPNLLQLRELLNNEKIAAQFGDAKSLDNIRHSIEDMLANISQQQSRAVEQHHQQNPVQVFSFQIPIKGEENPAELKIFYNKNRKKDTPEEYKLSLFLEMDNIGEIRSDFFQLKEDLSITFYVKSDGVKEYFEENLNEIEEALEPVFESLNLNVIVSEKKIAAFETQESEQDIISEKAVNVKV